MAEGQDKLQFVLAQPLEPGRKLNQAALDALTSAGDEIGFLLTAELLRIEQPRTLYPVFMARPTWSFALLIARLTAGMCQGCSYGRTTSFRFCQRIGDALAELADQGREDAELQAFIASRAANILDAFKGKCGMMHYVSDDVLPVIGLGLLPELLSRNPQRRWDLVETILREGPSAIPHALPTGAKRYDKLWSGFAVAAVLRCGYSAVPQLLPLIWERYGCGQAAQALFEFGTPEAVEPMIELLTENPQHENCDAIIEEGAVNCRHFPDAVVAAALGETPSWQRIWAVAQMTRRGGKAAKLSLDALRRVRARCGETTVHWAGTDTRLIDFLDRWVFT